MATNEDSRSWITSTGQGFLAVVALGFLAGCALLGYENLSAYFEALISDLPITISVEGVIAAFTLGYVWAFVFVQWIELLSRSLTLVQDPVPLNVNLSNREDVKNHIDMMTRSDMVTMRARHLLESWSIGWKPEQVMDLASYQSAREKPVLWGGILFAALVLIPTMWLGDEPLLTAATFVLLGLTALARMTLMTRSDYYIESHVLRRLPTNISRTEVTAADLAGAIRTAIDNAFDRTIPKPDDMCNAISTAVKNGGDHLAEAVVKLQAAFVKHQAELIAQWSSAEDATASKLSEAEKTLAKVTAELTTGLGVGAKQISDAFEKHTKDMDGANAKLADQLKKVVELGKDIEKVYHVQEMVDGTMKSVAATDEFKGLIQTLRTHLEESDKLLKEAAKPRTIRLVETEEGTLTQEEPAG